MAFFVELSADKYGNRAFTNSQPCVVEGEVIQGEFGQKLEIIAPSYIKNKWAAIYIHQYGGWVEVAGPARPLTYTEREKLIANYQQSNKGLHPTASGVESAGESSEVGGG